MIVYFIEVELTVRPQTVFVARVRVRNGTITKKEEINQVGYQRIKPMDKTIGSEDNQADDSIIFLTNGSVRVIGVQRKLVVY